MLIYSKPRQLFNFVRFLTCGRREKNKKSDECEEMGKMLKNESEKKFCRKKTCNNDDNDAECLEENEENWKRQFCPATKRCETSSSLSEIDLSDPCAGKQCRASPPPPPPTPQPQFKESCFCYQDIESCPSANEEIRARCKMWKIASFAVFPIIGLALSFILPAHRKSKEELEEKMKNSEFIPYPYMHRIKRPWWWGDGQHGLFFNPKVNKVPPEFDDSIDNKDERNKVGCRNIEENENEDENEYENENENEDCGNYNNTGNRNGQETNFRNRYSYESGSRIDSNNSNIKRRN